MSCKICQQPTRRLHDPQFNLDYFKCDHCQFIQQDPASRISFQEERALYDTHENSLEQVGYVNRFKNFLDCAVLPFKSTGLLLDFGSGPEPVLTQLIERDYDFECQIYDLHYAPEPIYDHQHYDVIVSTEVLEHLEDPLAAFEFFHQHLKEDGQLALMTIFHYNDDARFLKWWYRQDPTHISFFSVETLRYLADLTGFELVYHDGKQIASFKKISQ